MKTACNVIYRGRARLLVVTLLVSLVGCGGSPTTSSSMPVPSPPTASPLARVEDLVIIGRIVTMADPPVAEALFIDDGVVAAVGSRGDVLTRAGADVPVVDIGDGVAYPGFIDAHAHWIGDREYDKIDSPAAAMEAAITRGWTSISEQWVNQDRLAELEALAAGDALPLRVDAYLALNEPAPSGAHLGDWYTERTPGSVNGRLRVRGLKITLDNGWGTIFHWKPDELTETIGRANAVGWQVSVHTVSTEAHAMVLDALEAAIGPTGPNPLHHRVDHAIQVTDAQLARMVAMDVTTVVHLDGAAADWLLEADYMGHFGPEANPGEELGWLTRWRDFVDAGLHVAAATDTPWIFPGFALSDDIGRPVDQIAGGMDGRGRANPVTPPWMEAQLLTAEQGLRALTVDAAWALGDEARRGHLAPGALGDVTILSGDVTTATPDQIRAMTVIATIVDGVPVHCADPTVCGGSSGATP